MPLTLTILSAAVPKEKRGLALGAWGGISGLAVAFGPRRRRRGRAGPLVAVDLLAERADRRRPDPARALAPAGDPRAGRQARPAGPRARQRRSLRDRLGPRPRQRPGLGEPRDRRLARGRRRPRGGVRRLGAADGGADAADALLPQAGVRARERRVAVHVLRDVRLDLPALAVLPDRAGLLAARLRAADPAVDARADVHLPDRRRAVGPDPRQDARRDRPLAAGGVARLDGDRLDADRRLLRARRALRDRGHRDVALLRPDGEHRPLGRAAAGGGPGVRRQQRDSRAGRRVRRRRPRRGVRELRRLRERPGVQRRHESGADHRRGRRRPWARWRHSRSPAQAGDRRDGSRWPDGTCRGQDPCPCGRVGPGPSWPRDIGRTLSLADVRQAQRVRKGRGASRRRARRPPGRGRRTPPSARPPRPRPPTIGGPTRKPR